MELKIKLKRIRVFSANSILEKKIKGVFTDLIDVPTDYQNCRETINQRLILVRSLVSSTCSNKETRADFIVTPPGEGNLDIYLVPKGKYSIENDLFERFPLGELHKLWDDWHQAVTKFQKSNKKGGDVYHNSMMRKVIQKISFKLLKNEKLINEALSSKNNARRLLGAFAVPFVSSAINLNNKYLSKLIKMAWHDKNLEVINQIGQSIGMIIAMEKGNLSETPITFIDYLLSLPSTKTINKGLSLLEQKIKSEKDFIVPRKITRKLIRLLPRVLPTDKQIITSILRDRKRLQ